MMRLSLKCFASFAASQRLNFLLLLVGVSVVMFGFNFILGKEYLSYSIANRYNREDKLVKLKIKSDPNPDEELSLMHALIEQFPTIDGMVTTSEAADPKTVGAYWVSEDNYYIYHGRYFNDNEERALERAVLLSEGYLSAFDKSNLGDVMGSEIELHGSAFKVVGAYRSMDIYDINSKTRRGSGVAVPFELFIRNGYKHDFIDVIFTDSLSEAERRQLVNALGPFGFIDAFELPPRTNFEEISKLASAVNGHFLLLIVSLLTLLGLLGDWIRSSMPRFRVYSICGASPSKLMCIILLNVLYLSCTGAALVSVAFHFAQAPLTQYEVIAPIPPLLQASVYVLITTVSLAYALIVGAQRVRKLH